MCLPGGGQNEPASFSPCAVASGRMPLEGSNRWRVWKVLASALGHSSSARPQGQKAFAFAEQVLGTCGGGGARLWGSL